MSPDSRIQEQLKFIYGKLQGEQVRKTLLQRLEEFRLRYSPPEGIPQPPMQMTEQDAVLITYGDQIQETGQPPLYTLADFLNEKLEGTINFVHILPFYPYSSDDGFSVIDFYQVDPALGTWDDIERMGKNFRLMFDAVVNHISRHSEWFQGYKQGKAPYQDYFISMDPNTDLSRVVRPRALPLLTEVETKQGTRHVWTTFSDDQIDLNYANPQVLVEMIDILLFYVENGAEIIRLDAIAYLWKEAGTSCIHLPQTHAVVKLFRAILDAVAPQVLLITETNVPHEDNISYFGDPLPGTGRTDEAQMVYQFPLAPLVLHTFHTGNTTALSEWAASLNTPFPGATFFNFIASHDGIGVNPARGILNEAEIQALVDRIKAHGGQVSFKTNPDGSKSVYELNITLYDALNDPNSPNDEIDMMRFMASQVIMLSLAGVPGIYIHSLFGSRNCHSCVEKTGRARSINREKFQRAELETELKGSGSLKREIFSRYKQLLSLRKDQGAFHPAGDQRILKFNEAVFALLRTSTDQRARILCLVNATPNQQALTVNSGEIGLSEEDVWQDLIEGESFRAKGGKFSLVVEGYQSMWLVTRSNLQPNGRS
jgi:glucosylglycerate phosphorylase